MDELEKKPVCAGQDEIAPEAPQTEERVEGRTDAPENTSKAEERTETPAGDETPLKDGDFKFNVAFAASYALALLTFFICLGFGEINYGLAAFAFVGMGVQFFEFYKKSKKVSLLVTACLAGAAALTMLVLSIVALCVT